MKEGEILSCVNPLIRTANGRIYPLKLEDMKSEARQEFYRTGDSIDIDGQKASIIRCGKCIGCQTDKAQEWSNRLVMEASEWKDNWFVTLTFDDLHLYQECGQEKTVKVEHIQKFMKDLRFRFSHRELNPSTGRMRRVYDNIPIRFFACGEYGDEKKHTGRPHYHLIIFNLPLRADDLKFLRTTDQGNDLYTSKLISEIWPYGFNTCGSVTFESCGYVARYTMKKVYGNQGKEYYAKSGRKPPFIVMSRRPGIGHDFMISHDWTSEPNILVSDGMESHSCPVPQYVERYIKKTDPLLAEERSKIKSRLAFETMQRKQMQTDKTRSEQAATDKKILENKTQVLTLRDGFDKVFNVK